MLRGEMGLGKPFRPEEDDRGAGLTDHTAVADQALLPEAPRSQVQPLALPSARVEQSSRCPQVLVGHLCVFFSATISMKKKKHSPKRVGTVTTP